MAKTRNLPPSDAPAAQARRLLLALAAWGATAFLALWSARRPEPLDAEASAASFSAGRALEVMRELSDGLGSHPTGSAAHAELVRRLETHLRWLDYRTEVRETLVQGPYGTVGTPRNVLAWRPGRMDLPVALFVAHTDSVAAGPGAADDLAGVATLCEVARALASDRAPGRRIAFLFTDGEEAGLLGAEAFARHHPLFDEVGVVVNVEARGTSGASYLFETGPGDRELIDLAARVLRRPNASSLSTELYRYMPNDTDFSVFRKRGLPGANFAFIGDVAAYHTPLDAVDRLDPSSVQHQGEQVLALARGLREHEGFARERGEVPAETAAHGVHFTLFGTWLARYPAEWTFPLGLLAVLACAVGAWRLARQGGARWGRMLVGASLCATATAAGGLLASGLTGGLRAATQDAAPWAASPFGVTAALVGVALVVWVVCAWIGGRMASGVELHAGVGLAWGAAALFAGIFARGASPLLTWPALVLGALALSVRTRDALPARVARVALFALVPTVALWTPMFTGVREAFGAGAGVALVAPWTWVATLLLPLGAMVPGVVRGGMAALGLALVGVGGGATLLLPHHDAHEPARLNVQYDLRADAEAAQDPGEDGAEDGAAKAEGKPAPRASWTVSSTAPPPAALLAALGIEGGRAGGAGDLRGSGRWTGLAPALDLAPPAVELGAVDVDEEGARHVRCRLTPSAGTLWTEVAFDGLMPWTDAWVDDLRVTPEGRLHLVGERPVEVRLTLGALGPAQLQVWKLLTGGERTPPEPRVVVTEVRPGLPAEAAPAVLRPEEFVPSHSGDLTRVTARFGVGR